MDIDGKVGDLIEKFCLTENLRCYDPYDIWMSNLGIRVKQLYNRNKVIGILPAAGLTLWDHFVNNTFRIGYKKQEYPAVRALAALTLLNLYTKSPNKEYLIYAKKHIDWLITHSCAGYSGLCWGLGFKWAADDGLDYDENTPFSTHTPYALEAIHKYIQISGNLEYLSHVKSIFLFFEHDIQVMYEDEVLLATSYGPKKDRLVTNAVSYTLYAYSIFLHYFPEQAAVLQQKIYKLYNFICKHQRSNGSWLYEPEHSDSFIDCFHSCFILKNIFKSNQNIALPDSNEVLTSGYTYVKNNFYNSKHGLFKRFTLSNKPSIVKFDLYDNAEMLHLAKLLEDHELSEKLTIALSEKFVSKNSVYSVIDFLNFRKNKNTLRWAVMPYLYALSFKK